MPSSVTSIQTLIIIGRNSSVPAAKTVLAIPSSIIELSTFTSFLFSPNSLGLGNSVAELPI